MLTQEQGVVKSLSPFKTQTGAGFRVNFRRINEGGYPKADDCADIAAFFAVCFAKSFRFRHRKALKY